MTQSFYHAVIKQALLENSVAAWWSSSPVPVGLGRIETTSTQVIFVNWWSRYSGPTRPTRLPAISGMKVFASTPV